MGFVDKAALFFGDGEKNDKEPQTRQIWLVYRFDII